MRGTLPFRLCALALALAMVMVLVMVAPVGPAHGDEDDPPAPPPKGELTYPNLGSHLSGLADNYEQGRASQRESAGQAAISQGGSVAVTIYLTANVAEVAQFLWDNGGDPRNVGEDYIEAYVPVSLLGAVSEQPGVVRVREIIPPQPEFGPITSQGVQAHLATAWHTAGFDGQGVKVGIIDGGFRGFSSHQGTELPRTIGGIRCYSDRNDNYSTVLADCDSSPHGTGVAETITDVAPETTLYLADPFTPGDLQSIVRWMASEGVTVINMSLGWGFWGPGDGTSRYSNSPFVAVNEAVERGITWVNSAGNSGDGEGWYGVFADTDGDDIHEWSGTDERNRFQFSEDGRVGIQLRWDDTWRGATRDLDLHIIDASNNFVHTSRGRDRQQGGVNDIPYEEVYFDTTADGTYDIVVSHQSGGRPAWLQLSLRFDAGDLEHFTSERTIGTPAESANPGMLAVGASHYWNTNSIADYSSRGPTIDGRIKPDIVGTACAATASYELRPPRFYGGNNCWFAGTSQAAPHVAGLAALVKQANPSFTPQQVADYLKTNAADRTPSGPDNTWGHGFAQLPAPPAAPGEDPCVTEITADGPVSGTWAAGCQSQERSGSYARYYSFTLEQQAQVTIELESSEADTYLYLRRGDSRGGGFIDEDDDTPDTTRSEIVASLEAGNYTIEATTFDAGATGNFTLTVTGLGGTATGPGPDPGTDACGESITGDGAVSGTWATGCQSQARSGSYARYYSFTLEQQAQVTIELESSEADTYLYLRRGDARSGGFIDEDDDTPDTTRSEIVASLAEGTYTIEATTYDAGATGAFTLTVNGLGGTATGPGPDPGTDACGEAITGDGSVSGNWAAGCESAVRSGSYARYYSFTLEQQSQVTIELESSDADTYLYLRRGDARSGGFIDEDDDTPDTTRSEIVASLDAGTYTIEATTYDAGETGNFTLTVSGLGGTATGPGPGPDPGTDACGENITGDGAVSGTWAAGCESTVRSGSYARYYSFTLDQQSQVTIELESSDADTYLYLRGGDARSGGFIDEDDDSPDTTRSEIVASLEAGTYTIEATTYAAEATGSFTLTVSGLGGTATGPGPDPGTDACGESITGDGTTTGSWAAGCQSQVRNGSYARYYSFTLEQQSQVTIELESSEADTYLYLRRGDARSGGFIDEDDDTPDITRSEIVATLGAGSYTIEATTFDAGATGSFTLTVSGLGGTATGPGPGPDPGTDACGESITGDGTTTGSWAAGCQSQARSGSYARYYSFTLAEPGEVTIELESSDADTYLYLRRGDARSGAFIDDDDDTPDTTRSEIVAFLEAGNYTIEATTFDTGETGSFTLTVSGLGGTATGPGPGPDPGADACAAVELEGDGAVEGAWAADCQSQVTTPNTGDYGYARYYSFTTSEERDVTITLKSSVDPYLYIRAGDRNGSVEAQNDDHGTLLGTNACSSAAGLGTRDSCITIAGLAAGTYSVEATTYSPNETGSFILTVSGLSSG